MGRIQVGLVSAALVLVTTVSLLPAQAASSQTPSTTVVLPRDGEISGLSQYLDATASPGATSVVFDLSGGPSDLSDVQIATGTPTVVGWAAVWNTTTVNNGAYTLQSVASYPGGVSVTSPSAPFDVGNGVPFSNMVLPATYSDITAGSNLVLDALAERGVTKVVFDGTSNQEFGPSLEFSGIVATPTIVGWVAVIPGSLVVASSCPSATLVSIEGVVSYPGGLSSSTGYSIVTVGNPDVCNL